MELHLKAKYLMSRELKRQDTLYETYVIPHLEDGRLSEGYEQYIDQLDHFDVRAFRKVMKTLDDHPEDLASFSDDFTAIPAYITHRNNFDSKRKEILEMDGTPQEKQSIFDTLDRNRTREHNRVIHLFNRLNEYAERHQIAYPYPNHGVPFSPKNVMDRETVASILTKQEPLLETINLFVSQQTEDQHVHTTPIRTLSNRKLLERYGVSLADRLNAIKSSPSLGVNYG